MGKRFATLNIKQEMMVGTLFLLKNWIFITVLEPKGKFLQSFKMSVNSASLGR